MIPEQGEGTLTADECGRLEGKFIERTRRLSALFDLDRVLSDAANRYNLAAEVVHHGWPHRAD
jgi:hypothetical protein